MLFLIKMCKSG